MKKNQLFHRQSNKVFLLLSATLWLICFSAMGQTVQTHVHSGATWKYLATGAAPATDTWKGGANFDDVTWPSGPSPLGYGGDGEATVVPFGLNPRARYITTYFRLGLSIPDASGSFQLRYKRDDGIVIYLNGQEIKRENLPAGPITNTTLATTISEQEEPLWKTIDLPGGSIRAGQNMIAAEIHQASPRSFDIRFDLELTQTISPIPPDPKPASDPIGTLPILTRQPWRYLDTGTDPGTAWRLYSYDDQGWKKDTTRLGYGEPGDPTAATPPFVSYGPDPTKKYITTYFRKKVSVDNVDSYSSFELRLRRDDGIIVYINDKEVYREYLPTGPVSYTTLAATVPEAEEPLWKTKVLSVLESGLQTGHNIIAVEVHQADPRSSDMSFDLELQGEPRLFASPAPSTALATVFTTNADWEYMVRKDDPAVNWKSDPLFSDAAAPWNTGRSPLGYGDHGQNGVGTGVTRVENEGGTCVDQCLRVPPTAPSCYACSPRSITTYFRKKINLSNVAGSIVTLRYQRDDGIVIYINGQEVIRENMQGKTGDPVSYSTLATAFPPDANEKDWVTVDPGLFASKLREGANLITSEVHQYTVTSSDIRFNMELQQAPAPPVSLQRGPYLQRYSDDENLVIADNKRSMTIRWSTNTPAQGRVIYKTGTGNLVLTPYQSPKAIYETPPATGPVYLYDYSVTLENLEPGTPYSYSIECGDLKVGDETHHFKTAPSLGSTQKTRMWILGDFGKQEQPNLAQNAVRDRFKDYINTKVGYTQDEINAGTDKYVDLWLWLGDNAYGWGLPGQYQLSVFDVYDGRKDATQRIMKQTPIFAVPGNHDYHSGNYNDTPNRTNHSLNHYYDVVSNKTAGETAGKHSGKEEYYSFDHGNIHFVCLDSYGYQSGTNPQGQFVQETTVLPAGGHQLNWLNDDLKLAKANSSIKWIIVLLHHPPYSMGSKDSDTDTELQNMRAKLVKDIMETHKVDLVLAGHSHTYERTWPINGHYDDENEFRSNPDNFRVPIAANMSSDGRFDCITYAPASTTMSSGKSLIYRKNTSASKNQVLYVVNGSGGGIEGIQVNKWPHEAMHSFFNEAGSMYLEVEGNRLDGKFIDMKGKVLDQFKIIKDGDTFTIPATDGTSRKAECECNDAAGYTHYVERTPTGSTNLLLSIKKNGNNIGTVGEEAFDLKLQGQPGSTLLWGYDYAKYRYPSGYVITSTPKDYVKRTTNVQNRYWTLKATREIEVNKPPVSIRHYWKRRVDFSTFWNSYGAPFEMAFDWNFQTIIINDDCSPPPVGYERNPVPSSTTAISPHYSITKAPSYTANGAWVYKYGSEATSTTFMPGILPGTTSYTGYNKVYDADYSEFLVGRVKCTGGTIAGLWEIFYSDQNGNARMAALQDEGSKVMLYPNPTSNGKVFFYPALPYQSYQLTDMQGNLLNQEKRAGSLEALDLSAYPPGTYILVSEGEEKTDRFKIIKN